LPPFGYRCSNSSTTTASVSFWSMTRRRNTQRTGSAAVSSTKTYRSPQASGWSNSKTSL
jgi:hypothetical protein